MVEPSHEITQLLVAWSDGDQVALTKLIPLVESELRRLARTYMSRERIDHTLQTTALINEAYVKLINASDVKWQNRAHFFGVAAQMMRRILIDHAKAKHRVKRGGTAIKVMLDENVNFTQERASELLALDDALQSLARMDERKSRIVELRYFGGLTVEETAEVLGISDKTVMRDWNLAKAWLYRELTSNSANES